MIGNLYVHGLAALTPSASLADFPDGPEQELPKPDLGLLTPSLRRGLSDVTRLFMHTAQGALQDAQCGADQVHVVFASAFGEIGAAEKLIAQAYDENSSSPARFRNSVHNTAAGLLSISAKSLLPSTAIAAGWDTVAMGLLEASSLLDASPRPVLLVFAEERVPAALSAEHMHGSLSVALVLSREPAGSKGCLRALRRAEPLALDPFRGQNHPLAPSVLLCRALQANEVATVQVGDGRAPWCVDVVPPAVSP